MGDFFAVLLFLGSRWDPVAGTGTPLNRIHLHSVFSECGRDSRSPGAGVASGGLRGRLLMACPRFSRVPLKPIKRPRSYW